MQESVIYQEIIQKGLQQGKREEARSLIMRMMARRLGTVDPQMQQRVQALSLEQLEDLGEALLDFSTVTDLAVWLEQHQS